ncbi:MAG: hypothetical protein IAE80_19425 [Anaerolinea sp.]|nr:hypothetical protein [Anaerolinea sp.]
MKQPHFPYRILFADDKEHTVRQVGRALQDAGYEVLTASDGYNTPVVARKILDTYYLHAAILDLRMTNDLPVDQSGLELAESARFPSIRLIYTLFDREIDYPKLMTRLKRARLATGAEFEVVSKEDDSTYSAILDKLDEFLRTHLTINAGLVVRVLGQRDLVSILNETFPDFDYHRAAEFNTEVHDILRMTFHESWIPPRDRFVQLDIDPLPPLCPGLRWLKINAFTDTGRAVAHLALLGTPDLVANYVTQFERFPFDPRGRKVVLEPKTTIHLGLAVFPLPDEEFEELYTLRSYLESARKLSDEIPEIKLATVMEVVLPQMRHQLEVRAADSPTTPQSLAHFIADSFPAAPGEHLQEIIAQLATHVDHTLHLALQLEGDAGLRIEDTAPLDLPNPAAFADNLLSTDINPPTQMSFGVCNLDSVLIGSEDYYFLSGGDAAVRSCLYDFITLELSIRRGWVAAKHIARQQWLFEEHLYALADDSTIQPVGDDELVVIAKLRETALSSTNLTQDAYLLQLAGHALRQLLDYPASLPYPDSDAAGWGLHCLILAAHGYDKLYAVSGDTRSEAILPALGTILSIEFDSKVVSIGNVNIALSPRLYALFKYLYDAAVLDPSTVISKERIDQEVLGYKDASLYSEGRVHKTVFDLRQKLESIEHLISLKNIPGEGYYLMLHPSIQTDRS